MRFRPRFTVRTLAIFVTVVCAYFGAWDATKRWGVPIQPTTSIGYQMANGVRLWIITEAVDDKGQRAATTTLLPEEY